MQNQISEMSPQNCAFMLPLEIDSNDYLNTDEKTPLNGEPEIQPMMSFQGNFVEDSNKTQVKFQQRRNVWRKLWFMILMIKWHVLFYCIISSSFYAIFHYCLSKKDKKEVADALSFLDDWRQLVFFFGIYLSYAVKKVGDVSSVSTLSKCNMSHQ